MTDQEISLLESVVLAITFGLMALVVFLVGRAIMSAARYAPGSQLVVVLAMLATLAVLSAIVAPDLAGDFTTLSATAIGALAAALTTWYQRQERSRTGANDETDPDTGPTRSAAPGPSQDAQEGSGVQTEASGATEPRDPGPRTDEGVAGLWSPNGPDGPGRPVEGADGPDGSGHPPTDGETRTADDDDR